MAITANQVKELRERTGLGMMECKAALTETQGDMEKAIDHLRKKAGAKVEKKAHRTAAEGAVATFVSADGKTAALVEVNSETDFVAKDPRFAEYAADVARLVVSANPAALEQLMETRLPSGRTVEQERVELIAKFGENMHVRRFERYAAQGLVAHYLHGRRIGVLVELSGGDEALARDIAMHIAASRPTYVSKDQVPAAEIEREREVFLAQSAESGKPREILEKMVTGKIAKYLAEVTLLGQAFVKNPDISVEKLLDEAKARVIRFRRYEVGEGIEKAATDFAAEVMAQVKGV